MPKRTVKKGYKLKMWHSHHEPRKVIRGPLSYWIEPVHSGKGWDKLVKNLGMMKALSALGFFSRLQQRTARLPREWRGYVLDGAGEPATVELLARECGLSVVRVRGLLKDLSDVGWLGRTPLRRLLKLPSGAPTKNDSEDLDLRQTKDDPAGAGGGRGLRKGSSPSPTRVQLAADLCSALGVNPHKRADQTLFWRLVEFHTDAGQPKPSLADVKEIALRIRSSAGVASRMAVFQSELQKRGLHYAKNRGNDILGSP